MFPAAERRRRNLPVVKSARDIGYRLAVFMPANCGHVTLV
jgi:hypothetical protein